MGQHLNAQVGHRCGHTPFGPFCGFLRNVSEPTKNAGHTGHGKWSQPRRCYKNQQKLQYVISLASRWLWVSQHADIAHARVHLGIFLRSHCEPAVEPMSLEAYGTHSQLQVASSWLAPDTGPTYTDRKFAFTLSRVAQTHTAWTNELHLRFRAAWWARA